MKSDTETELVLDSHIADSELVEDEEYLLVLVLDEVDVSAKSIAQERKCVSWIVECELKILRLVRMLNALFEVEVKWTECLLDV
uniref:AlNc14C297G10319 protein n=1 Tax=Albugo laibachii Nc14 TaxID=890382 RepID=F0WVI4_9STRA|nr:AlNc14C297G10319 [Albugo laibachii Nc14]|eukprot:CCA25426.1 AlNc14C297G10319 [Albugo laibachii Nc14]